MADSWQSRGSQGCCHSTKTEGHILGCATEPASFHRSPQGFPKNKSAPRATAAPRAAAVQEDRIQAAQCRNTAGVLPERTCGKWKGRGARTQTCLLQGLRKSAGRALPPPRSSPVPGRVEPGDAPGVVQAEPALSSPNAAAAPPDHKPSAGCHGPRPRALPLRRSGGQRCRAAEPRLPERGGNESGHARGLRGRSCRRAATPSKWLRHRRGPSPAGPPVPPPTRRARRTAPVAPRSTGEGPPRSAPAPAAALGPGQVPRGAPAAAPRLVLSRLVSPRLTSLRATPPPLRHARPLPNTATAPAASPPPPGSVRACAPPGRAAARARTRTPADVQNRARPGGGANLMRGKQCRLVESGGAGRGALRRREGAGPGPGPGPRPTPTRLELCCGRRCEGGVGLVLPQGLCVLAPRRV